MEYLKRHKVKGVWGKLKGRYAKASSVAAQDKRTAALAITREKGFCKQSACERYKSIDTWLIIVTLTFYELLHIFLFLSGKRLQPKCSHSWYIK